jgi:hypothetical protein
MVGQLSTSVLSQSKRIAFGLWVGALTGDFLMIASEIFEAHGEHFLDLGHRISGGKKNYPVISLDHRA